MSDGWESASDELERIQMALQSQAQLRRAGVMAADAIRSHIDTGAGFSPLSPATIAYRGPGQPLKDTGALRDSINSQVVSSDTVSVGTTKEYAPRQNNGETITAKGNGWVFIPAAGTRQLERRYGKKVSSVLAGLKGAGFYVYRAGRTMCYRKKGSRQPGKVVYYLKKSVTIPARRFFYLSAQEVDEIMREVTDAIF